MVPMLALEANDLSSLLGSISIACWLCVAPPQIIKNVRRRSAEGLSLAFLAVWLTADIFNVTGAVIQGLLPTIVVLACYFTTVDSILLVQILYYQNTVSELNHAGSEHLQDENERDTLLSQRSSEDIGSSGTSRESLSMTPGTEGVDDSPRSSFESTEVYWPTSTSIRTGLRKTAVNIAALLSVVTLGAVGWYVLTPHTSEPSEVPFIEFDPVAQAFGYLGASLYIGARLPQLLKNYRRRSTSGISLLFFLFAVIGNVTLLMSIFLYQPGGSNTYSRYIAVNASWIISSLGSLILDCTIFLQFMIY